MLCCLNPDCDRPIDPDGHAHCQNCGVPLVALLYNRFKVVNPIGRGGFGKTYLAEDTHKLSDRCVIKQLAYRGQGTQSVQPANAVLQDLQEPPPVLLTVPLSIPPISPTVPISTSPLSLSASLSNSPISPNIPIFPPPLPNEIDPTHLQFRKGFRTKLAWLFGIGLIWVAIANGMKGNDPKSANQTSPSVASSPSATNQLTAKELFEQADKKSSGGDKQGAIADYTKAIALDPKYTDAYNNRGTDRSALGDKQGAIADFNKAIELDPKFADAYYNRGNAHASLDNRSEAIRDFQKAADLYLKEGKTKGYQDALDRLKKLQQH